MPRRYRPEEGIRVLQYLGWAAVRQRASHVVLTRVGQPVNVVVPTSGREVPIGTLANFRRQAGVTPGQFEAAAEEVH
jgi:predicted RNA binding protein YcfA (HicA-like mRNA interferase family)